MTATPNRLASETSPYLRQHSLNPVDWYPWGDEAFGKAEREGKPILLSVGYAACHWCHVMERESFEDPETARLMNEKFVSVKVDREERPDVDAVYMNAVQAMTGRGGWPMTVFLAPDGKPFYGGTYFPPEDRHGLPAFRRVLEAVDEAWRSRRDEVERQGTQLVEHIARLSALGASPEPMRDETLTEALRAMGGTFDREWGGFGEAPKFPQPSSLEFLLRMHARGAPDALPMLSRTLDAMARGGIFDQVGGGFHRYSVDRVWLVPHFEKMLYDNAQLLRLYARAWLATGVPLYRETALATAEWMLREMLHPAGGFFSSLDADSDGEEGAFSVWTAEEFEAACGPDAEAAAAFFGVAPQGNWEGRSVLWVPAPEEEAARGRGMPVEDLRASVARARARLFEARARRARPATDDKVLAAWNGLSASGLAEAGRIFGRPDLVEAAARAAEFVLTRMRSPRLLRSWRDGRAGIPAFLEDHAMMAAACLDLYETTFEVRWFEEAMRLAREILDLFGDPAGGFFDTGSDVAAPVIRPKTIFDGALPSGNAVASEVLLRLAALTGDADLERAAVSLLRLVCRAMEAAPLGFGRALGTLDLYLRRPAEIAIVGDPGAADTRALCDAAGRGWITNRVLAVGPPGSGEPPLLRGRTMIDGRATAYVCRGFVCERPVTEAQDLLRQLGE